jgi:hypothetical protein
MSLDLEVDGRGVEHDKQVCNGLRERYEDRDAFEEHVVGFVGPASCLRKVYVLHVPKTHKRRRSFFERSLPRGVI